jgi:hypothetical protein
MIDGKRRNKGQETIQINTHTHTHTRTQPPTQVMVILIREFTSPDEEMKKIVLKVVKQCVATEGVPVQYVKVWCVLCVCVCVCMCSHRRCRCSM